MWKRMIVMLTVTMVIVAGLGFVKFKQIQTAMAEGAAFQPPPEAVTTIVAQQEEWPATLSAIGTMAAVQGVTVSADLPGTVEQISSSRRAVRAGEVLAVLDTAGAGAARGDRGPARAGAPHLRAHAGAAEREGDLEGGVRSRDRRVQQTEAQLGEIRAVIQRKTIRAPFSGMLGIRQVNLGQYLAGGDRAGDAAVAQSDLRELRRAAAVRRSDPGRPRA